MGAVPALLLAAAFSAAPAPDGFRFDGPSASATVDSGPAALRVGGAVREGTGSAFLRGEDRVRGREMTYGDAGELWMRAQAGGDVYRVELDAVGFPPEAALGRGASSKRQWWRKPEAAPRRPEGGVEGGVVLGRMVNGGSGLGVRDMPARRAAVALWGIGRLYRNDELVASRARILAQALPVEAASSREGALAAQRGRPELDVFVDHVPADVAPGGYVHFVLEGAAISEAPRPAAVARRSEPAPRKETREERLSRRPTSDEMWSDGGPMLVWRDERPPAPAAGAGPAGAGTPAAGGSAATAAPGSVVGQGTTAGAGAPASGGYAAAGQGGTASAPSGAAPNSGGAMRSGTGANSAPLANAPSGAAGSAPLATGAPSGAGANSSGAVNSGTGVGSAPLANTPSGAAGAAGSAPLANAPSGAATSGTAPTAATAPSATGGAAGSASGVTASGSAPVAGAGAGGSPGAAGAPATGAAQTAGTGAGAVYGSTPIVGAGTSSPAMATAQPDTRLGASTVMIPPPPLMAVPATPLTAPIQYETGQNGGTIGAGQIGGGAIGYGGSGTAGFSPGTGVFNQTTPAPSGVFAPGTPAPGTPTGGTSASPGIPATPPILNNGTATPPVPSGAPTALPQTPQPINAQPAPIPGATAPVPTQLPSQTQLSPPTGR